MTSSSFTAGSPLPDDVACTIGTSVAAMTQLRTFRMCDLSLHSMKALADGPQPLERLLVRPPDSVNWVSVSMFCQCAHDTILSVAVFCMVRVTMKFGRPYVRLFLFQWYARTRTHTRGKLVPVVVHCKYACSQSTPAFVKRQISTRRCESFSISDRCATFAFQGFVCAACCLLVRVFIYHGLQSLMMVYSDYVKQRVLVYYFTI